MKKLYDLAVKNGTYQKDGKDKGRYVNVGAVMENDDGGKFLFISAHVNFAAFPRRDNTESVIVSMFDPKPVDSRRELDRQFPSEPAPVQQTLANGPEPSDDIPF